jgi:hypothetical protein
MNILSIQVAHVLIIAPLLPGGWILGEKHAKDDEKKGYKCESKKNKKGNIE